MKRTIAGLVLAAAAVAGTAWVTTAYRNAERAREAPAAVNAGAPADAGGAAGSYDPGMAAVCQYGCAIQEDYDPADLAPQPGVAEGRLTRCPVSGVVFAAGPERPRVEHRSETYVTCCETCADKLRAEPGRFLL